MPFYSYGICDFQFSGGRHRQHLEQAIYSKLAFSQKMTKIIFDLNVQYM